MQIVIDIPEEQCEWIKEHKGVTDFQATEVLYNAVRNAFVLPKGHGRLIDADKLDVCKLDSAYDDNYELDTGRLYANDVIEMISNAPTALEADKEVE